MFDDTRAYDEVRNSLMKAAIPPIDLVSIRRRMNARHVSAPQRFLRSRVVVAMASAVVITAGLFLTPGSAALLQNVRQSYEAALHAAGIGRPSGASPAPEAIINATK